MLTAINSGDSPSGRLMFQPDAENVASGVYVAVVDCAAVAAFPAPYSKRAHPFRTAGRHRPAARARLGTVLFIGFDIPCLPSGRLVSPHVPDRSSDDMR